MSGSAPAPSWAPGYDTAGPVRQGLRARIVRATRTTSGADVVLKILSLEEGRTELEWLRDLSSVPGVVPLVDAGNTTTGEMFVALPYYPDGSFADMLSRMGPAPILEASAVARSVAVALGALHARGSTHNGVAPGNVLRAGRTPVLTGFGVTHPTGQFLAPPPPGAEAFVHSPPEALRGEPRSPASDVYMLASTVWTLLVGRAPFAATDGSPFDPRAYAGRVLNEPAPPVPRSDVSRKLRGVLSRALSKQAEHRYPTMAEFSAAFEQARTSRPATTVSGGTGGQPAPPGPQSSMTGPRAPLSGPQAPFTPAPPMSGPQVPPNGPPAPLSGPQTPITPAPPMSGPQVPLTPTPPMSGPQVPPNGPPAPVSGPQVPFTPVPPPPPPVEADHPAPAAPSAPPAHETPRPVERALPTPAERAARGAVPETSANTTADIAMARLRGEEISPLITWSRLKGWSGVTEDSYLPVDEEDSEAETEAGPVWDPVAHEPPGRPRWREHLHIAVTVCGVLVVGLAASAFGAVNSPEPSVAAAEAEETEEAADPAPEEAPPEPVAEPSPPPEVSPPSEVRLEDTLSAVTVSWTDHTGGTGSYFVVGGRQGFEPLTLARTGPGAVTAQITVDDTQAEYCFTVVAVDGGSAPAEEVCTTRAAERQAEADRLAEEEAAEEEEEEEEDDPQPSPSPSPSPRD
ncbi:serine/threonine protein kinase [Nocardiopsis ganjiahuensis]|uniref:serine/threonine protein kinase n=1 Tax=Nocardiopsis ganjiahuensis TaxID=239984 RepID=UPI000371B64E|nr:protein kinase [Nocardiopsis ganjiahuensis]